MSRYYLNHRYSDDLDFFVNDHPEYLSFRDKVFSILNDNQTRAGYTFITDSLVLADHFGSAILKRDDIELKVDLVNDIPWRLGEPFEYKEVFFIDTWENILSNKISAIFRFAGKDLADIWALSKRFQFNWKAILASAREKDLGLDAAIVAEIVRTTPVSAMKSVNWTENVDISEFYANLRQISDDILRGCDNSLCLH